MPSSRRFTRGQRSSREADGLSGNDAGSIEKRHSYELRSCPFGQDVGRVSEVLPHGIADDPHLGREPTDAGGEPMVLQPHERPDRTPDVVPLAPRGSRLAPLHPGGTTRSPTTARRTSAARPRPCPDRWSPSESCRRSGRLPGTPAPTLTRAPIPSPTPRPAGLTRHRPAFDPHLAVTRQAGDERPHLLEVGDARVPPVEQLRNS